MAETGDPISEWQRQKLPPQLSRRFEFASYGETRKFLDDVAALCAELGLYPNMSFGKTYASITIDRGGKEVGEEEIALARKISALVGAT